MAPADLPGNRLWSRFYVPEIHDIHPKMETSLDVLLNVLPETARQVAALLVVPNWMMTERLHDRSTLGWQISTLPGEKVLHGYTHSLGPNWVDWLLYGHDNRSEFRALDGEEARRRIIKGLQIFADLRIRPRWFCAPRWQQSRASSAALVDLGFFGWQYKSGLETTQGDRVPLPALCFDEGERRIRIAAAHVLRSVEIARLLRGGRPFRLTLHPSDAQHPRVWAQIQSLRERLEAEGYVPLSLEEAVARWRRVSAAGTASA